MEKKAPCFEPEVLLTYVKVLNSLCYKYATKVNSLLLQSKEEMNTMITTRIEEMWETLDRNQSYQSTCFD